MNFFTWGSLLSRHPLQLCGKQTCYKHRYWLNTKDTSQLLYCQPSKEQNNTMYLIGNNKLAWNQLRIQSVLRQENMTNYLKKYIALWHNISIWFVSYHHMSCVMRCDIYKVWPTSTVPLTIRVSCISSSAAATTAKAATARTACHLIIPHSPVLCPSLLL